MPIDAAIVARYELIRKLELEIITGVSVYPADWSEEQKAPAFVVDAVTSQLVAANGAARELFGIVSSGRLPLSLDSSMPAIARLRTLARRPETAQDGMRLMFWCEGTARPFDCDVRDVGAGETGQGLYSITVKNSAELSRATSNEALTPVTRPTVELADQTELGAAVPRDEMETLKEIARQIRKTEEAWGIAGRKAVNGAAGVQGDQHLAATEGKIAARGEAAPRDAIASQDRNPKIAAGPVLIAQTQLDLAKLAHELKTPLSAIAAASEVMRDERLGPIGTSKYRDYAGDIHNSAAHAIDVIDKMLSGRALASASPDVSNIDLNNFVAETVSSLLPLAEERGLDLGFDGEASNPVLLTDKTALRQILINLLTNALKYTPEGGVVRAATGYLADASIFVVVRDTGLGFAAPDGGDDDDLSQLKQESYGRLQGSYGFGLPLVKQLAARLGADVEIDSKLGKGTVVLVAFPGFASVG